MSYDHYQLGVRESLVTQLACCDCGGEAQGNYSCDDGNICDACDARGMELRYFFSAHPPTGDPKPGTNYPHCPCRHRHRTLEGATKCATNDGKSQVWHVVEGVTKAIHEVKLDGEDYRTWQRRLASVQYGRGPAVHPAKGVSVKDYT